MQESIQKFYEYAIPYGMNVIAAIVILIVGRLVSKFTANLVERSMLKARVDKTLSSFGRHLAFYGMMTFVCIAALNKLGVETSSLRSSGDRSRLFGGGFSFLQGSLANFASGVCDRRFFSAL